MAYTYARGVAKKALQAVRLDPATRSRVNARLDQRGLDGNRSFRSISEGLSTIGKILSEHGLEWDDTLDANLFLGDNGQRTLRLAKSNEADAFSPASISNSLVRVGWYKHPSGNYEITAYLS